MNPVYIVDSIRTPRARANQKGGLNKLNPYELLDFLYKNIESKNFFNLKSIDEVILGCVTQFGEQAGNIAKASSLFSGYPDSISGLTINRFCSSSLDAINLACLKVQSQQANNVIAGGVEMMSRVPMLSDEAAIWNDIEIAGRAKIFLMGSGADLIASLFDISREDVDKQALKSQQRALNAQKNNYFKSIIPVTSKSKLIHCVEDECIRPDTTLESLASLEPSFKKLGEQGADQAQLNLFRNLKKISHVHTAGNSPAMSDAASMTLLSNKKTQENGHRARAKIISVATVNDDPLLVLSGCILATQKILSQNNLKVSDVDLFEIHEAFASTMIHCQKELKIDDAKLNVNGGCIALGHPMGATGSIMMSTLVDELERRDLATGIVATSGAAGAGTAILIERI
ncbi:acetyl-CoA C-acyltransferase [Gammaproteobacteria bacterium]|nr:acetyl-CoA C-acyltransferase [Gammaproteobacteria bacterium]MDC0443535.1 acetyl-CoA C-acyltransferase [Gammaproteobacteria bacterium]